MKKRKIVFLLAMFLMVLTPMLVVNAVDTKVEIAKYDEDGQTLLSGAVLKILDENDNVVVDEWTTDENLKDITSSVTPGNTYKIHEVTPPKGYTLSDDVEFKVAENEEQTFSITNKTIKLTVNKVDDNGKNISGALLELYEVGNDEAIESWVSTEKGHEVEPSLLEYGKTYQIVETKVPIGYVAYELTKEITINEENNVVNFENKELNIKIANYDENGVQLEGVKLQIEDENGNIVEEPWNSTDVSHSVDAKLEKDKTYYIVEVETPNGYMPKDPVEFTVTDNLQQVYSIKNERFNVTVTTIDQNDDPISNVKYKILDNDNNLLYEFESNGTEYSLPDSVLNALAYNGEYKLVAEEGTKGYIINTSEQSFRIDSATVKVNSVHTKIVIKITKYDEDNITPLEGAKLQILDSEGKVVEEEWSTTTSAYELTHILEQGKTYKIHETYAPNGYVKSEDVEFKVTNDITQQYSIKNDRIKISVLKTDNYDEPLAGALLQLIEKDGSNTKIIDSWTSSVVAYEIPFEKIRNIDLTKTHYLREITAPTGYSKITTDTEIEIGETSELQSFILSNNPNSYTISIRKIKSGTNTYVEGATLELYEGEGVNPDKLVHTWTTGRSATYFGTVSNSFDTPVLKYGRTYTIHEVEAPNGYVLSDDQSFVLDDTKFVDFYNKKIVLSVSKINESDEFIENAKLQLKDGDTVLHEWTTGDGSYTIPESVVKGMQYNKEYVIHEDKSPVGYAVSDDIKFKFSDYDTEEIQISMTDKKFSVSVSKLDENNNNLTDAVLHIEDEYGNMIGDEWTTTDSAYDLPESVLNHMYYGKTYYVVETESPAGYAIASEPKEFKIDKEKVDVTFYNFKFGVNIINYDEDGQTLLDETKLQLIDNATGEMLEEWTTTGNNPYEVQSDLVAGNEYRIHVETPKLGYVYVEDVKFTATSELTQSYSVTNKKVKLSFLKVGKDNQPLAGAKLALYEEGSSEVIAEWESDTSAHLLTEEENAKIDVNKKYYILEVKAPIGYIPLLDSIPITIENDVSDLQEIRIENELKTVKVNVNAIDKTESTDLSGVELELYKGTNLTEENKVDSWITDGSIKKLSTTGEDAKLVYGETYTLHVKSIPNGYISIDDIEFTIDDDFDVEKTFTLELEKFNIKISKTGKNGELVPGATLELIYDNGTKVHEFITTGEVYAVPNNIIEQIPYGSTIKLRETKAPAGYIKSSEVKTIEINQKNNEIEFANIELGINIINYDEDGSTYLSGTKLQILDETKENVLEEWTTTDSEPIHIIDTKLNEGNKYYIHVDTPSNGYIKALDKVFTITNEATQEYSITNEKFNIEIIKVDDKKQPLKGAFLELFEEGNSTPIDSWISEEEAHILSSDVLSKINITKNYFIRETQPPTGYSTLSSDIFISIKNETNLQTFEVENNLKQYDILINAVDEGNNNIAGATIELYEGDVVSSDKLIDSWVSTESARYYSTISGRYSTDKLEYGKTYTIHVVKTPRDKVIESNETFTIDDSLEESTNIKIVAEKYSISISKLDEDGSLLAGATLQILDENGNKIHEFITTDSAYNVPDDIIEKIPYGSTIKLIETEAPAGYVRSSEEKIIEINQNEIDIKFANLKLGVNIINYDEDSSTYLNGTTLQLLDSGDNVIEEWTTDESTENSNPHLIEAALKENSEYHIHVSNPSNGHIIPADVYFTVANSKSQVYSITNPRIKLEVEKKDEDGNRVEGALLSLKEAGTNTELYHWVSSSTKAETIPEAVINEMSINKSYYIEETQPPVAYQELTETTPLEMKNTGELQTTIVMNKLKEITLSIQKVNPDKIALSGNNMKLELYTAKLVDGEYVKVEDVPIASWSDSTKIFTTINEPRIKYGQTYIIHEEKAPNGYVKAKDTVVTIEGENGTIIPVEIVDEPLNVKVENIISGRETSGTLKDAELQLLDSNGKVVEEWTTTTAPHVIQALLEGGATYTIHEVSVPNGYDVSSDVSFTVKDTKDEQIYQMITNEHELDVRVSKYNEDLTQMLEGAKFELYSAKKENGEYVKENGKYVKDKLIWEWESSKDGYTKIPAEKLHLGIYIIHESEYPIPYQPQTKDTIDTVITVNLDSKPQLWNILNRKTITSVVINKVDRECSEELCHISGSKLHILDSNGNKVDEWISDGKPHIIDNILVPGQSYKLVEEGALLDANQAYQHSEDLDLGVIQNIEETQTFTMYTDKTNVKAIIYHNDENGEHLADGTYRLYEGEFGSDYPIDASNYEECSKENGCILEWDTSEDEDGHDISEYVRPGYTYTISQVKIPYGYKPFDSVVKVVGKNQDDEDITERVNSSIMSIKNTTYDETTGNGTQTLTITNEKKDIAIHINNFGSDGMATEQAEFELLDPDGNVVDSWLTDGNYHIAKNIKENNFKFEVGATYTIHQLSVPNGYLIDNEYIPVEILDTEETRVINIENSRLLTLIINVIDEKNQYLPGVTMQILDKDGNVKVEWKTDSGPYNAVDLPAPNTYIVRQKAVPSKYVKESDQYVLLDPHSDFQYTTFINYEKKVLDNPETLDDIVKYVIIAISSLLAVVLAIFVYKKSNKSKG